MDSAGSNPAIPRDKCSDLHVVCLGNDFKSANLSKILTFSIKYVIIFIENEKRRCGAIGETHRT